MRRDYLYRLGFFYVWGIVLLGELAIWSILYMLGVR